MPTNLPRPARLLIATTLTTLLAACGSGGGDGGVDDRCFKVTQVAGWTIHVTSSFADHAAVDTFTIATSAAVNATATAGPAIKSNTNPNAYTWYGKTPTGTISVLDSFAWGLGPNDSIVSSMVAFGPGPSSNYGPYLSVNLATCQATLGAIVFGKASVTQKGQATIQDTLLAAFPFVPGLTIDSLAVANGFTVASTKVPSVMVAAPFGSNAEYRVGGLTALYSTSDTNQFDSATVSWTATPVSSLSSPTPAPEGVQFLPNGAIILPRRR